MNTFATEKKEEKGKTNLNKKAQISTNGGSTSSFVDYRPASVMQRKLQEMADHSNMAKLTAQRQKMANNNQNNKVTQFMFPALGQSLVRNAPRIATGIGLAGSLADMHANSKGLDLSKLKEPEHFKKFTNIGREAIVSGLSLTPFGKVSSAISFANNMYDMQDKIKENNPNQAIKSLALAEIDKVGATGFNLGIFGSVVTALGGAEKLLSNKEAIISGFTSVAEFIQAPPSPDSPFDPML